MEGNFETLIQSQKPVLIDFFATWCGPCKTVSPILQQLKERLADNVTIIKIDIDKNPALTKRFKIQSVPTLMLFKNGKTLWRQSGVVPLTNLESIIKQYQ
jgi:thioredoxin 1